MTTLRFPRKSLVQMASAALLALFAAACQPAGQPAAETSPSAAPTAAVQQAAGRADLVSFKTGEFAELDLTQGLSLPTSPFLDAQGQPHTFAEFAGKVVVFNMWGEWCAPCVEEMPTLAALQQAFPRDQVVVIPIAVGTEAVDVAKSVRKLTDLAGDRLPFYYDPSWKVGADVKSGAYPTTIIYGRDGREAARLISPAKWDSEQSLALIRAVLAS
jgi:thiol-disulfide isomerase/thioredoxin